MSGFSAEQGKAGGREARCSDLSPSRISMHTRFGGIPSAPQNAAAFIGREHSGRKAYGNVHRIAAMRMSAWGKDLPVDAAADHRNTVFSCAAGERSRSSNDR